MLTLPGDIPLVTPDEIAELVAAHRPAAGLYDRPVARRARLECDHLLAARRGAVALWRGQLLPASCGGRGMRHPPTVLRLPGIALDVDTPEDLAAFALSAVADPRPCRAGRGAIGGQRWRMHLQEIMAMSRRI